MSSLLTHKTPSSFTSPDKSHRVPKPIDHIQLSHDELHNRLQEKIQLMSKSWKGSIPTEVFVCVDKESDIPTIFNHPPQLVDICEYLGGAKYPTSRLYFPSTKFPPPSSSDDMKGNNSEETCVGWRCLKRHLIRTALHNGQIIVSNGGGESERALTCSHYRLDRDSKAMPVTNENPYREDALVNNRKQNRQKGNKDAPRRIKTVDRSLTCNFRAVIKWDQYGFYISLERRSGKLNTPIILNL